jgi:transposase-like protein
MLGLVNTDTPTQHDQGRTRIVKQLPTASLATEARANGVRHRLTPDQRREIARLYAESGISVAELRQRFGVSEPSVYRILQTQGVALRGRGAPRATAADGAATPAPNGRSRKQAARNGAPGRRSRRSASASTSNGTTQFRIVYRSERVVSAADIRDALRQAESLGAGDIVGLTREQ